MTTNHDAGAPVLGSIREKFELKGRNYVVTGGAQGIGFAVTRGICEMGGNVAVIDMQSRPTEAFGSLSKQFNVKTEYFQADVSKEDEHRSAFERAVNALGSVHGILTAAGIAIDKAFVEQTWAEAEKVQQVNVSFPMAGWVEFEYLLSFDLTLLEQLVGARIFLDRAASCQSDAETRQWR